MAKDIRLERFDEQIEKEMEENGYSSEKPCKSYWAKLIYMASKKMNTSDWVKMRQGDYWQVRDSKNGIMRDIFIYDRMQKYIHGN
jgi:hypothetical protein